MPWSKLARRLRAREQKLAARSSTVDRRVVARARFSMWLVDVARVAVVLAVVLACVRAGGLSPIVSVGAGLAAYAIASLPRMAACDAILGRALATISPRTAASLASAGASPIPGPVDRDAVDFDDAA